jgi:isopentenyl-diphosphate delta-isomerase
MNTALTGLHRPANRVRHEVVSFDDEDLILVDPDDRVTGYASKRNVHEGDGLLHRAFSVFLFDGPDRVLLQQRAENKPLWPGYWANSCCSHPRRGESSDEAARRRLQEELGASTRLEKLYSFRYRARYLDRGSEHELCAVYVGSYRQDATVSVNREEICDWGWFSREEIDRSIVSGDKDFAPWFLLEWEQLKSYREALERITAG